MSSVLRRMARFTRSGRVRGLWRLTPLIADRIPLPDGPVTVEIDDWWMVVDPRAEPIIDRTIYRLGVYEPGTLAMMRAFIRTGDTVLDVGANIGQMTLFASRLVGPKGRVIAVEPAQRTFELLRQNVEMNAADNVRLVRVAAGRQTGEIGLHFRPSLGSGGASAFGSGPPDEVVPMDTIDHIAPGAASFMKLDVEGFEVEALAGATETLVRGQPIVCMEYSKQQRNTADEAISALVETLDATIYRTLHSKDFANPGGFREVVSSVDYPEHDNVYVVPASRQDQARKIAAMGRSGSWWAPPSLDGA